MSSPLVHEGAVFVQAAGGIVKVDVATGKVLWITDKSKNGMYDSPFSSPIIETIHQTEQLIALSRSSLQGVDLSSGEVLWSRDVPSFRGMNILTPTIIGNKVLTATYGGKTHMFEVNRKSENKWDIDEVWQQKFQGYMSSPVVVGNYVYLHGRSGRMVCVELSSGETQWTSTKSFGKYCSMVTDGESILTLSDKGVLYSIQANPTEFNIQDEVKISKDPTWAHIGLADNQVFIRSLKSLSVFEWRKEIHGNVTAQTSLLRKPVF